MKIPEIKAAVIGDDRQALPQFVEDLDSEDAAIRFYSIQALRRMTDETFGYDWTGERSLRSGAGDRALEAVRDRAPVGVTAAAVCRRSKTMSDVDSGALFLRTTSDTSELAGVRRQIEAFCLAHGFGERAIGEVGLCVNEAMANVIRHAYKNQPGQPIEVTASMVDDTLRWRSATGARACPRASCRPTRRTRSTPAASG